MKLKFTILFALTLVVMSACNKEELTPSVENNSEERVAVTEASDDRDRLIEEMYRLDGKLNKKSNNGKGKGRGRMDDPPSDTTVQDPFVKTYQISEADDSDPLFRFSISESGGLMMLESDSTVGDRGSDFYGLWSDPFKYSNNQVRYHYSLTAYIYDFEHLSDNRIDVTRTKLTTVYLSTRVDTTITHPGLYKLQ